MVIRVEGQLSALHIPIVTEHVVDILSIQALVYTFDEEVAVSEGVVRSRLLIISVLSNLFGVSIKELGVKLSAQIIVLVLEGRSTSLEQRLVAKESTDLTSNLEVPHLSQSSL